MASPPRGSELASESIGVYLARQRALRGISQEELARITRIPLRSLQRLESGAFDHEPDGFARGFVRAVALAVGLDPADAVARMLAEPTTAGMRRGPRLRRIAAAALLVCGGVGVALAGWTLLGSLAGGEPPPPAVEPQELAPAVRRDAVRALAVSQGLIPADRESRALPLAPAPPPPEAEEPPVDSASGAAALDAPPAP